MEKQLTLTQEQQKLVEHFLSVVDWVILDHIRINPHVCGLGYHDVYQEGCLHLCRAAATYTGHADGFGAYARAVVRNGLISYCREISRQANCLLFPSCQEESGADYLRATDQPTLEQSVLSQITDERALAALRKARLEYTGVVRLGIEALELKVKGMSGQEIAAKYGVKPNLVGAWISRAAQRLRRNREFVRSCCPDHYNSA